MDIVKQGQGRVLSNSVSHLSIVATIEGWVNFRSREVRVICCTLYTIDYGGHGSIVYRCSNQVEQNSSIGRRYEPVLGGYVVNVREMRRVIHHRESFYNDTVNRRERYWFRAS